MPLTDYTTGNVIGKGTYGEVSLVKHKKDRKQYVIKRVDIHNASKREQEAAEREADLLSQIRHPNIVSYKESFQANNGFLYIVMAFCEGGDMYSRLKAQKGKYLEERQIVEWFVQIAMALQYLHDNRILHRDLKTQNIFLTKSKIIKVGDLGIARVLDNASDMATTLIGTPYYMSPELFSNKPYSYKSDVWALGCCLYEMCTLKHAFNAKDMHSLVYKILKGKLPTMPKIYSDDLCEIIKSMLAQEPETRPSVARLLRHSFIKKQIALFLEGTKNRQRKRSKGKATQESSKVTDSKSEISLKSDSGYSGMDSRETPDLLTAALPQRKRPGDEDLVKPEVHREEQKKNHCEEWVEVSGRGNAPGPMHDAREVVERKYSVEKIHAQSEIYCGDVPKSRRKKKDGRENSETNDRQQSRSRPLPPKPPNQAARAESNSNTDVKIPRERRRFKVAKPMDDKRSVVQIQRNSKNRVESGELKPTVSSGNPTSARERRRQRERESMAGRESAPPSSVQILSPSADRLPVGPQITSEGQEDSARSRDSSLNEDTTDGPPRRITPSQKKEKSNSGPDDDVVEENSSGVSDADENSLEEAMLKSGHKARRKESTDVNSLISALDTTLKLSEQRQSPDLDLEPEEERTDEPGDISVSSGRLRDRIDFLRRDCIQGLGEADFLKACDIIDSQSEENVEHALVKLIGRVKFEKYGGKIWQLKFCETFKRN